MYNKNAQKFNDYNLTAQQETILFYAMEHPRITMKSRHNLLFKSAVSQVLAKHKAQNFITRESNPNNHLSFSSY
jgi:DNA-binding MarR family transcriptional regulator